MVFVPIENSNRTRKRIHQQRELSWTHSRRQQHKQRKLSRPRSRRQQRRQHQDDPPGSGGRQYGYLSDDWSALCVSYFTEMQFLSYLIAAGLKPRL